LGLTPHCYVDAQVLACIRYLRMANNTTEVLYSHGSVAVEA
jgi:hypothetical protein